MSNRAKNFKNLADHPLLGRLFQKLTKSDLEICLQFLEASEQMNDNEYEHNLNRLFLDKEKTKNWKIIQELLSCSK